ncbi:hypothetical protein, partial [Pectobacterium brasiliense]|uniref:hypothetical protein n=1 Tax=Pectobacterium brasiliense TaxID=180957 RepID=UPI001968BD41
RVIPQPTQIPRKPVTNTVWTTINQSLQYQIDDVNYENVKNASESGQTIADTGHVGNEVKAGDAITVKVGSETYQTTEKTEGKTWSENVP